MIRVIRSYRAIVRHSAKNLVYGGPTTDNASVKIAGATDIEDPDRFERRHDPAELRDMIELARDHVTGLYPAPVRSAAFTDLYSADGHGIGRHPAHPNVLLAEAYSGRGFKPAPAIGDSPARLTIGEPTPEIAFMPPNRFTP